MYVSNNKYAVEVAEGFDWAVDDKIETRMTWRAVQWFEFEADAEGYAKGIATEYPQVRVVAFEGDK